MSAPGAAATDTAERRVLVLGRSPEVLETVLGELAELGIAARGSTTPERAADAFDAADFDLVAFGGGVPAEAVERLGRRFAERNPAIRTLHTFATRAVREIAAALDSTEAVPPVDLGAYATRIGHGGPLSPTLETLRALHRRHPAAIVFEAVDVLLDRGVDLAPAAVDDKLIRSGRGGYCFEQNGLFRRVLAALGFRVEGLAARIRWQEPAGVTPGPRTHMALRVTVDGVPWLADVGFGGCVLTAPLRMDTTEPQETGHETFRVIPFGDQYLLQMRIDRAWRPVYELSPEPRLAGDCEVPNWYTATHPSSRFRQNLMVARTTDAARYTLLNGRLTVRPPDGEAERRVLDADGIERTLAGVFGLPVEPAWRPVIERAAASGG